MESDREENEETEEEESRDLSMWIVTIPHVIMETRQVIVNSVSLVVRLLLFLIENENVLVKTH